jgi:multicomponent Na+:H+ antiporter subunit G
MNGIHILQEIFSALFLLAGSAFIFLGCLGVVRLPDVYCRGHALGKAMTLGISLMLIGLWIHIGFGEAGIKVVLAILFQFATIPVAAHLLTLHAYKNNFEQHHPAPKESTEATGK